MFNFKKMANGILSFITSMSIKKIIVLTIVLSILVLPTVSAFGYVLYFKFFNKASLYSVTIYDEYNNIITHEEDHIQNTSDTSLVKMFYDLSLSPTPTSPIFEEHLDEKYIRAELAYGGTVKNLLCYFQAHSPTGYYFDEQGNCFLIPENINEVFLSLPFSESFYGNSKVYKLNTIDNDEIIPESASWNYKNNSDKYVSAQNISYTTEQITYEITNAINLEFEKKPSKSSVSVYDKNELIYFGDMDGLHSLTFQMGSILRVIIDAEWKNDHVSDRYGSIHYDFKVKIKNPSVFSLHSNVIYAGDFVTLECTNISDPSKIVFKSDTSGYSPIFSLDGNTVKAFIYFPESKDEKSFDFSISYGASIQKFSIKILPTLCDDKYDIPSFSLSSDTDPSALNSMKKDKIHATYPPQHEAVYFHGNFDRPDDQIYEILYTHNSTVRWGENLENSFVAFGNEYIVKSELQTNGASVKSLQNGVVSYVGDDAVLGKFIVIDHGCGLRTWYSNLSSVDVHVNDIVLIGEHIGKAGKGSLAETEGFTLFCTIYDTIINPNSLWINYGE